MIRYAAGLAALAVTAAIALGYAGTAALSHVIPLSYGAWERLVEAPRLAGGWLSDSSAGVARGFRIALPWIGALLLVPPILVVPEGRSRLAATRGTWSIVFAAVCAICALTASLPHAAAGGPLSGSAWDYLNAAAGSLFGLALVVRAAAIWQPKQRVLALAMAGTGLLLVPFVELPLGVLALMGLYAALGIHLLLGDLPARAGHKPALRPARR